MDCFHLQVRTRKQSQINHSQCLLPVYGRWLIGAPLVWIGLESTKLLFGSWLAVLAWCWDYQKHSLYLQMNWICSSDLFHCDGCGGFQVGSMKGECHSKDMTVCVCMEVVDRGASLQHQLIHHWVVHCWWWSVSPDGWVLIQLPNILNLCCWNKAGSTVFCPSLFVAYCIHCHGIFAKFPWDDGNAVQCICAEDAGRFGPFLRGALDATYCNV